MKVSQDEVFRQMYVPSCPICGQKISLAMKVDSDMPGQPSDLFWGPKASRRRICSQGAWFHFEVMNKGQLIQRVAYLMKKAEPPAAMATEEGVRVEGDKIFLQQQLL